MKHNFNLGEQAFAYGMYTVIGVVIAYLIYTAFWLVGWLIGQALKLIILLFREVRLKATR